ncbi:unnamed protein product [Protopolystoma xenopodis]|uniref:Tetraspanin n=1 Tax=Protopolystoma xenopodis TaxID=117903 RepID=A0A448WYA2_9PLAT|nr:unnamed protein product [Protopolystoma xenopodis]
MHWKERCSKGCIIRFFIIFIYLILGAAVALLLIVSTFIHWSHRWVASSLLPREVLAVWPSLASGPMMTAFSDQIVSVLDYNYGLVICLLGCLLLLLIFHCLSGLVRIEKHPMGLLSAMAESTFCLMAFIMATISLAGRQPFVQQELEHRLTDLLQSHYSMEKAWTQFDRRSQYLLEERSLMVNYLNSDKGTNASTTNYTILSKTTPIQAATSQTDSPNLTLKMSNVKILFLNRLVDEIQMHFNCCGILSHDDYLGVADFQNQPNLIPPSCCMRPYNQTCLRNPTMYNAYLDTGCGMKIWSTVDPICGGLLLILIIINVLISISIVLNAYLLKLMHKK